MSLQKSTNQPFDSSLNCSMTKCVEDETKEKLQCAECKNYYHYRCTQLPAYQIQAFIEKRIRRHYYCQNCITVPVELERLVNPTTKEQQEIKRLRRDIKRCENLTRMSEENSELTRKLVNDQLKKFDEKTLEKYIDKKFNELGETLSNNLKDNNKTSFSEVLKKDTPNDFQTIIRVAKIEEKKEERDHSQRQKNIIIHGATEVDGNESADKSFVDDLLKDISYKAVPDYIGRIGSKSEGKSRPLKVVFNTLHEKRNLFNNLKALKEVERYRNISVSDDYTIAERTIIREWVAKAKEKNQAEPQDSKTIWRVRGSPKSGLMLRKFTKHTAPNQ